MIPCLNSPRYSFKKSRLLNQKCHHLSHIPSRSPTRPPKRNRPHMVHTLFDPIRNFSLRVDALFDWWYPIKFQYIYCQKSNARTHPIGELLTMRISTEFVEHRYIMWEILCGSSEYYKMVKSSESSLFVPPYAAHAYNMNRICCVPWITGRISPKENKTLCRFCEGRMDRQMSDKLDEAEMFDVELFKSLGNNTRCMCASDCINVVIPA